MTQLTDEVLAEWAELATRDDWHLRFVGSDIRQLIGEVQRFRAGEPQPWVDASGALHAPDGYHFTTVDAEGFDASGYPRKTWKLARNLQITVRGVP